MRWWQAELLQGHDIRQAHGLRVPEDIAVLGVDDEQYICEHTTPSLSSIRRDNGELFAAVARQMRRMFASRGRPCDAIVLKPDGLCVRQSSRVLTNGVHAELLPCLEFIRCQACNGIGVAEVVREVGLPRRTVEDLFRRFVGRSILEEIERVRFEKVFDLLAQGCVRLDALASFSGYNTVIAFRKDISKDPAKYRVAGFVRDGKPILAAWCIEGDCEWEVPEAFGPLVDCRDLCGNPQPVPVVGGRTIRLTERPVYLLGK